jgi:hypothetical protein
MPKAASGTDAIFELKVTLLDIYPPIWRTVRVPGSYHLGKLHGVIQAVMPWEDSHLHAWEAGRRRFGAPGGEMGHLDEKRAPLEAVAKKGTRLLYEYDFGDGWRHEVRVEKVTPRGIGAAKPSCTGGARACPP